MKKVYISIPMTGKDMKEQRERARLWHRFFRVGAAYQVINPFYLGDFLDAIHEKSGLKPPTYEEYLDYDIRELANCTHIFLCDGWTESKGCMAEVDEAIKLGLQFITERNIKLS